MAIHPIDKYSASSWIKTLTRISNCRTHCLNNKPVKSCENRSAKSSSSYGYLLKVEKLEHCLVSKYYFLFSCFKVDPPKTLHKFSANSTLKQITETNGVLISCAKFRSSPLEGVFVLFLMGWSNPCSWVIPATPPLPLEILQLLYLSGSLGHILATQHAYLSWTRRKLKLENFN